MSDKLPDNLWHTLWGAPQKPSSLYDTLFGLPEPPSSTLPSHPQYQPALAFAPPKPSLAGIKPALAPSNIERLKGMALLLLKRKPQVNRGRVLPKIEDLSIMGGRTIQAAFVYNDLSGFSKLVAGNSTVSAFVILQTFVDIMTRVTGHYGGTVVDCAGDQILSVFYRPVLDPSSGPVHEAVTAALWMQTAIERAIGPALVAAKLPAISASIGIDYGFATVGCVGIRNNKRLIFLGNAANNAAKLQELGQAGQTILSPSVYAKRPSYLDDGTWHLERQTALGVGDYYRMTQRFSDQISNAPSAK